MDKRELAYVRQAVPAVKDWDVFQAIIRNYRKLLEYTVKPAAAEIGRRE